MRHGEAGKKAERLEIKEGKKVKNFNTHKKTGEIRWKWTRGEDREKKKVKEE
jgi:hypothetical protein